MTGPSQMLTGLAGTSFFVIMVDGSTAGMPSIPIKTDELVITRDKPPEAKDRFLGPSSDGTTVRGWINLKAVGIDG